MRRPFSPLAALALALGFAGCASLAFEGPANTCGPTSECVSGTCDERGFCVTTFDAPFELALEVVPASDPHGSPVPVILETFEVDGPIDRDLNVPFGVTVFGAVRWLGEHVDAEVRFTPVGLPSGLRAARVVTRTFVEPQVSSLDGALASFTVQLAPGRTYDMAVEPIGAWRSELPVVRRRLSTPTVGEEDTGARRALRLDETYPDDMVEFEGRVVTGPELHPRDGARVRAIEPTSGRVVSSTFVSGSDETRPGYFRIRLSPGVEAWSFQISGDPSSDEELPVFTIPPTSVLADDDGLALLRAPELTTIRYTGIVEVARSPGRGVASASVTLTSNDVVDPESRAMGSFRASAITAEDGTFETRILPGTYDVVVSPIDRELGIGRDTLALAGGEEVRGQLFEVPRRARFDGEVRGPDGAPISFAQIRADARGGDLDGTLGPESAFARSSEAVTSGSGLFELRLDVGRFDIIIEPAASSRFPWQIERDVVIEGSASPRDTIYELTPAVPVSGVARFEDGSAVGHSEIRAFGIVGEGGRAVPLGRATTDAEGRFTLLLPPTF